MVESLNCENIKHRKETTLSAIKMLGTPYMCAFYVATAGLQGASLGSDEEEIVLLIYVIIDLTQNKVRFLLLVFLFVLFMERWVGVGDFQIEEWVEGRGVRTSLVI